MLAGLHGNPFGYSSQPNFSIILLCLQAVSLTMSFVQALNVLQKPQKIVVAELEGLGSILKPY